MIFEGGRFQGLAQFRTLVFLPYGRDDLGAFYFSSLREAAQKRFSGNPSLWSTDRSRSRVFNEMLPGSEAFLRIFPSLRKKLEMPVSKILRKGGFSLEAQNKSFVREEKAGAALKRNPLGRKTEDETEDETEAENKGDLSLFVSKLKHCCI